MAAWLRTRPRSTDASRCRGPGLIHTIRVTGTPDISGATMHEFDVSIRPEGGDLYDAVVEQSMLPFQMEGVSEGQAVVVRSTPTAPPPRSCTAGSLGANDPDAREGRHGILQGREGRDQGREGAR